MLSSIRKFSNTIFAKIFLFIVAIPFVFWGMGNIFSSGNKNTIAKIGDEKISTREFAEYLNVYLPSDKEISENLIDKLLSDFIGNKLIAMEVNKYNINISDKSLAKLIRNEKIFIKKNEFSRIEYEKFLVKNSLDAATFEKNVSEQEEKKQLLDFIGGGIIPSIFSINMDFDKINQKRKIKLINLNNVFKKEINITNEQIKKYFEDNKEKYIDTYKSINFIILNSKNLTEKDDYSDLFFKKIDEIDDLIVEGKNLNYILQKYNLENAETITFNNMGKDKNLNKIDNIPLDLLKNIFNLDENESTTLIEHQDKYFIFDFLKTEVIQKKIEDISIKKDIELKIKKQNKNKILSNLIAKINKNNFNEMDFNRFSKEKEVPIKNILIKNINDEEMLKKDLVNQIYNHPQKKVVVVASLDLEESYLIFIDEIKNVSINKSSKDYSKYFNMSKLRITNNLYSTYDAYLKQKYDININYNALNIIKNDLK